MATSQVRAQDYFPTPGLPVPENAAAFRRIASAFRDPTMFPDEEVEFWLMAGRLLLTCRWGGLLGAGIVLFAEHNLALGAYIQQNAAGGGIPGMSLRGGVISSESAGGVSISYDSGAILESNAGHWNETLYGQRFIRLARMIGAGPVQLNVPPWAGLCGGCGCGGMFDFGQWGASGIRAGPGWHNQQNVPVGQFIPPRPQAFPRLPDGWTVTPLNPVEPGPNYTFSEGTVLSNPETGERVQLRSGEWVFIE